MTNEVTVHYDDDVNQCYEITPWVLDGDLGIFPVPNPQYLELDRQTPINVATGLGQLYGAPGFGRKSIFAPVRYTSGQNKGKMVQVKARKAATYAGRHLELAIARAKRYMRNNVDISSPPRHVAMAMLAFMHAEPEDFQRMLAGRAA